MDAQGRDGGAPDRQLLVRCAARALTSAGVSGLVVRLARRADVRAHPHAFRRAVATSLVRGGASVLVVKELLGHADMSTTAA
ncbi:MAG: tyrosine-type recombinase/integrase [Planctomycetes bacterium]|nr:tyrosine-type recombinase/integrase [Planctomycetota bacterium]